jgi:hypothetical protein
MAINKRAEVIVSIKKLVALGVSDEEIINNLAEVGLNKEEALQLIKIAKGKNEENKSSKEVFDETTKKLSLGEQITNQLGLEKDLEKKDSVKEQATGSKQTPSPIPKVIPSPISKTIPSKSNETKEPIKEKALTSKNMDEEFGLKIKSKQEIPKSIIPEKKVVTVGEKIPLSSPIKQTTPKPSIKTEIKAQTKTIDSKLNAVHSNDIEALWKKGIIVAVNTKLDEMRKLKGEVDSLVSQKVDSAVKKETRQLKVLLDSQKDLVISSNKEALEQKQKEITLIIDGKISEFRNQASELTKKMASVGTAKQEQEKHLEEIKKVLEDAKKMKSKLLVEMNSELVKSQSKAQEFIDKADVRLKEMDERVNRTLTLEKNVAEGLLQETEQKIEQLTIAKADELINELQIEVNKLKSIEKNIDLEGIEQKVKMLEQFKKEFVNSIEESLTKINETIDVLNKKNELADKALKEKTLAIDAKIEELTKFEKSFTDKLDKLLEKDIE